MERANVANLVTAHLASHLNKPEHGIYEDADIFENLGADSLDVVELTLIFEETFSVEIPDSDVEELHTVGDIINLLHKKVSENMVNEQNATPEEETLGGGTEADQVEDSNGGEGEGDESESEGDGEEESEGSEEE